MTGIVTVTPAAAIDQTYRLGELRVGDVNRAVAVETELSGKGVNVARAIALAGVPVSAVLPLGPHGRLLAEESGFTELLAIVPTEGRTRVNSTLLDAGGRTTKVNESPVPLTPDAWAALVATAGAERERLDADWLVLSGSIPPLAGTEESVPFLELLRDARADGIRIAVDTAGAALRALREELGIVSLVKPNTHELAELVGRPLASVGDVVAAARELRDAGCEIVYVSMGADGALAVSAQGVWHARAAARVVNTSGAGDASLAGFLVGAGVDIDVPTGLRTAASWGALAVSLPTTLLSGIDAAPDAELTIDPDPGTALTEPAEL